MLFFLAVYCSYFASLVAAICCKNHNPLCLINSIQCDPNCPDGASYCYPDRETCNNNGVGDSFGGCVPIRTVKVNAYVATSTIVSYTDTTTVASATDTFYEYRTDITSILETETKYVTLTVTSTSTQIPQVKLPMRVKRELTSTRTVTDYPCSTAQDDYCTNTISTVSTKYVDATTTVISNILSTYESTTTTTITFQTTIVYVITAANSRPNPTQPTTANTQPDPTQQPIDNSIASSTTTRETPPSTPNSGSASETPSSSSSSGLSSGVKAGIGAGVAVAVIVVLLGSCFGVYCCRRKRRDNSGSHSTVTNATAYAPPFTQANSAHNPWHGSPQIYQHHQHSHQGSPPLAYYTPPSHATPDVYPVDVPPMTRAYSNNTWSSPPSPAPAQFSYSNDRARSPGNVMGRHGHGHGHGHAVTVVPVVPKFTR